MTTIPDTADTVVKASHVPGPLQGSWTYADWEALPADSNRYEIINGVLYMTTAPHSFHQWIIRRLERFIGIPAEDAGLAYSFSAPIGVIMPGCDPVQPDYVVVLQQRSDLFRAGRIYGVPDLIIEVLSPGTRTYDERIKLPAYAAAGVPEYAIIDPQNRTVSLRRLEVPGRYAAPIITHEAEVLTFACLSSINVHVRDLFTGAPDTSL
ncbi:MAG: Uma2 family endonuclease [Chloroflexales bacterium]|nr:Uma2 family endonuclease [Chloroflexales bacterium]